MRAVSPQRVFRGFRKETALLFIALMKLAVTNPLEAAEPSILLNAERLQQMRQLYQTESGSGSGFDISAGAVILEAQKLLDKPPVEYRLLGPRLLSKSREAIHCIGHSATAWLLSGNRDYLDRALAELEAAASFPDWNPSHFLDVAEMSAAFVIGLDWLSAEMESDFRLRMESALLEKGVLPGLKQYRSGAYWTLGNNNWTQVCNGGLTLAALALLERYPQESSAILAAARESMPGILRVYEPHGAYPEGPVYWRYGTVYHILMADALLTATGRLEQSLLSDSLTASYQPVIETMDYRFTGFNFGDGLADIRIRDLSAAIPWLALQAGDESALEWFDSALERLEEDPVSGMTPDSSLGDNPPVAADTLWRWFFLNLIWHPEVSGLEASQLPGEPLRGDLDPSEDGKLLLWDGIQPWFVWKSGEGESQLFLAGKGGTPGASHAQMDVGSFVLYRYGVKWAVDPGRDNYNIPGYFSSGQNARRWKIYRNGVESHNLLRPGKRGQLITGTGKLSGDHEGVLVNLDQLWNGQADSVSREFVVESADRLKIIDRWSGSRRRPLWQMLTEAEVQLRGREVLLHSHGRILHLSVEGAEVEWDAQPANPGRGALKGEHDNPGITKIQFRAPAKSGELTVIFKFISKEEL